MKKTIFLGMLSAVALSLCGCLNPHLGSMGASTMIVAHQPRLAVNGDSSAMTLSVDLLMLLAEPKCRDEMLRTDFLRAQQLR